MQIIQNNFRMDTQKGRKKTSNGMNMKRMKKLNWTIREEVTRNMKWKFTCEEDGIKSD